jgi:adenylosuccinate lyase
MGNMTTALSNCEMPYARNLAASSNSRINLEDGFKFLDHGARRLANVLYWLGLREDRSKERVERSYGVVTSQKVMTYLTDHRKTPNPMTRSAAHDLMGELATYAWQNKILFVDVLLKNEEVTRRIDEPTLREITNPLKYTGQSREIVQIIYNKYYNKKILDK